MKKAARNQLPHFESDGSVELGYNKMANRPEREPGEQPWTGCRFKYKSGHVYADQQSCESRHKSSLTASDPLHTKVTKDHDGHNVTEISLLHQHRARAERERTKLLVLSGTSPVNPKEFLHSCFPETFGVLKLR